MVLLANFMRIWFCVYKISSKCAKIANTQMKREKKKKEEIMVNIQTI